MTCCCIFTLGADTSWQGVVIIDPKKTVTIGTGLNNLTLGSSGIDMSLAVQNLTFSTLGLNLAAPQTWNVASGRTLTVTGASAGTINVAVNAGSNLLTVTGAGNTTFTKSAVITSTGGLLKTGRGPWRLTAAPRMPIPLDRAR